VTVAKVKRKAAQTPHQKRRARTARRMRYIATGFHEREAIIAAAIKSLPAGHALKQFDGVRGVGFIMPWEVSATDWSDVERAIAGLTAEHFAGYTRPPYALTDSAVQAELRTFKVGQSRKAGRPPKPVNSNDKVMQLLLRKFPDLFTVSLTADRKAKMHRYLRAQCPPVIRTDDALTKAISRAGKKRSK